MSVNASTAAGIAKLLPGLILTVAPPMQDLFAVYSTLPNSEVYAQEKVELIYELLLNPGSRTDRKFCQPHRV